MFTETRRGVVKLFIFACFMLFCQSRYIWKLESEYPAKRTYEQQSAGSKLWDATTGYGVILCTALCLQDNECSFSRHENHVCNGYRGRAERPTTQTGEIHTGHFRRSLMRREEDTKGYRKLTSRGIDLYVKRYREYANYSEALHVCNTEGGNLVKLDSFRKASMINRAFYKGHEDRLWIGLMDPYDNNTWYWADGTPLGRQRRWDLGQPDNGDKENYAAVILRRFGGGKFFDSSDAKLPFICEVTDY